MTLYVHSSEALQCPPRLRTRFTRTCPSSYVRHQRWSQLYCLYFSPTLPWHRLGFQVRIRRIFREMEHAHSVQAFKWYRECIMDRYPQCFARYYSVRWDCIFSLALVLRAEMDAHGLHTSRLTLAAYESDPWFLQIWSTIAASFASQHKRPLGRWSL